MFWSRWNMADKTLLFTAVFFLFALCLHLQFPASVMAEGLLFCAEAALVGGAADWFAVTALFERPLGFPWHTAILPSRRAEFIEAFVKLVEREFFSYRNLFSMLEGYDWRGLLCGRLEDESLRREVRGWLGRAVGNMARGVDVESHVEEFSAELRRRVRSFPSERALQYAVAWLREDGRDRRALTGAASYLRGLAESPETAARLAALFRELQREKLAGAGRVMGLFAGLASKMNVVNLEELAACVQEEAVLMLDEASTEGSALRERLLEAFYAELASAETDAGLRAAFETARDELMRRMPIEETLTEGLSRVVGMLRTDLPAAEAQGVTGAAEAVGAFIDAELARWSGLLRSDPAIRDAMDALVYDAVHRSALAARTMSGAITRAALRRMTDEQLSSIVYGRIEPDLLWIRMNGSVVGALIGLLLFLAKTAVRAML